MCIQKLWITIIIGTSVVSQPILFRKQGPPSLYPPSLDHTFLKLLLSLEVPRFLESSFPRFLILLYTFTTFCESADEHTIVNALFIAVERIKSGFHSLGHLNTWPPSWWHFEGRFGWRTALLEKVRHWGQALRWKASHHVLLTLPAWCKPSAVPATIPVLPCFAYPSWWTELLSLWNTQPK